MRVPHEARTSSGHSIRAWVRKGVESGAAPLLVSILSVQAAAALAQLIVARNVSPSDFGVVRAVEAMVSMLLLIASAGMPSLAVRDIAAATPEERPRLIARLMLLASGTAIAVALAGVLGVRWLVPAPARPYFLVLVWSVVLTAASRTALNYFQGVRRIAVIARLSTASSLATLGIFAILVSTLGMRGWLVGRYASELVLLAVTLWALRGSMRVRDLGHDWRLYSPLWWRGMLISAGLIVRTAQDNIVTVVLAWLGVPREVGNYGLAVLALTPLLLVPSILGNLAVPRFVHLGGDLLGIRRMLRRLTLVSLLVSAAGSLGALVLIPPIVSWLFPEYLPALSVLPVLLLSIPLRSVAMIPGALFMAIDRNELTVRINLISLAIAAAGCALLVPRMGARGGAWAMVLSELFACAIYLLIVPRVLRKFPNAVASHAG